MPPPTEIFVVPSITLSVHPSNSNSAGCAIKLWHSHPLLHSRNKNQGPETSEKSSLRQHRSCWAAPHHEWLPPHADTAPAASSPPPLLLSRTEWQYRTKACLSQPEKTEGFSSLQQCVTINHIPTKPYTVVKTSGSKPSFIKRNKTKTNNKNNAEQTTAPLLLGPSHPSRSSKRLSGQKDLRDYQLLLVDMQLAALWSCPMKAGVPLFTVSFLLSHQLFLRDYVSCFHCFASICHSALPLK